MRRTVAFVIALLTFTIGLITIWHMNVPSPTPSQFNVQIPSSPVPLTPEQIKELPTHDNNFVVSIEKGGQLTLNGSDGVGSVADPSRLTIRLRELFEERVRSRAFTPGMETRTDLSDREKTIKVQVTVRAPRSVAYEDVVRVVDAAKGGGADPVLLQVDGLPK